MVMVQEGKLKEYINKGLQRSMELSKPVLVSRVKEIKNIDPLLFFTAGKEMYEGERTFWTNPTNTTVFVGLGSSYTINNTSSTNRFEAIEKQWQELVKDHIMVDNYSPLGTGPLLFGGFSFDPLKEKTLLWEDFSNSKFVLPEIMLSIIDGKTWLTTNIMCKQGTDHYKDFEEIEERLLNKDTHTDSKKNIAYKKSEIEPQRWKETVIKAAENVRDGEVEKVVLAREVRLFFQHTINTDMILGNLKEEQPMSYLFAFESGNSCFIGASPERLILKKNGEFLSTCLAGSIKRGQTVSEDDRLAEELLTDRKNLIEHDVVVQMIKSAMEEVCNTISSPNKPSVIKMRDIQHLYTPVKGKAKPGVSILSMVERLHPTPALGGQPQKKALEKIRELEILDRGWYGGPIGWLDAKDNGEFAVAIRSGLLQGKEASLFAGCGIVGDSEPESEYNETNIKFKPMLSALGGYNHGE